MCHISSFIVFLEHHNTPIYNLQQILLYTAACAASPYSPNINGKTAAVRFADGEDTITFRKAKGRADISGDYNTYKENKTIKVKNTENSVKGNDGINTATWQKDGFAYSFSSDQAMTQDALTNAIENLI